MRKIGGEDFPSRRERAAGQAARFRGRETDLMKIYSYFPGCTLKDKARELERQACLCAEKLGFSLREIPNWQCCGAVYPMAEDEIAPKLSAVRALQYAREQGQDLVTVCAACHHVIKRVNDDMAVGGDVAMRANRYLGLQPPYQGQTRVLHYLEVLRDEVGFDTLRQKVVHPLSGRRVGAYYGCMLLRPSSVLRFDDPESPTILEDFLTALGAEPILYPMRNECCGGYRTVTDPQGAARAAARVTGNAAACGAQELMTACPLCRYNLEKSGTPEMKVTYFTELLAQALGVEEEPQ